MRKIIKTNIELNDIWDESDRRDKHIGEFTKGQ